MRGKNKTRRLKLKRSKLHSLKRPKLRKRRKTKKRGGTTKRSRVEKRPLAKPGLKPSSKKANQSIREPPLVGDSYWITRPYNVI